MTPPFFERLKKYYASIGSVLRGEADASAIFPNAGDIGTSRERIYAEILRSHLPSSCNVLFGGFLFGQDGTESKQIDILVTEESSMQYNFLTKGDQGKSFACVDGCIAVVSVKSNLDSTRLIDSLLNISSIPDKQPLTAGRLPPLLKVKDFDDWPYKIVYASEGTDLDTTLNVLTSFYEKRPEIPVNKRPNLIHVIGKYSITRTREEGGKTRNGTILEPNKFHAMPDPEGVFGLMWAISQIQAIASASKIIFYSYGKMIDNIPF